MLPIGFSTIKKPLTLVTVHPVYALTRRGYMRIHDERTLYRMTSPATDSIRIRSRDGTCRFWLQVTFARILWTFNGAGATRIILIYIALRIISLKIKRSAPVQFVRCVLSIASGLAFWHRESSCVPIYAKSL